MATESNKTPVVDNLPENPDTNNESSGKKSSKKKWIWIGAIVAVLILFVVAWEVTASAAFCATCHEIRPSVEGWRDSAHFKSATCMDCHSDKGFIGEAVAHIGGVQEVVMHVAESPGEEHIRGKVPAYRCLECHDNDWDKLSADHPTKDSDCGVCHRETAHTNPKTRYVEKEATK